MEKYAGDERRNKSWHLDKTISIGHILTTLTVAGNLVLLWLPFSLFALITIPRLFLINGKM